MVLARELKIELDLYFMVSNTYAKVKRNMQREMKVIYICQSKKKHVEGNESYPEAIYFADFPISKGV